MGEGLKKHDREDRAQAVQARGDGVSVKEQRMSLLSRQVDNSLPEDEDLEEEEEEEEEEEGEEAEQEENAKVAGCELKSLSALVTFLESKLSSAAEVKLEVQAAFFSTDKVGNFKELGRKYCPATLVGGLVRYGSPSFAKKPSPASTIFV